MFDHDTYKLDNPYNDEPGDDEPAYAIGGDILDRELVRDRWVYLVRDEDTGEQAWLSEGEVGS